MIIIILKIVVIVVIVIIINDSFKVMVVNMEMIVAMVLYLNMKNFTLLVISTSKHSFILCQNEGAINTTCYVISCETSRDWDFVRCRL